VAVHGEVLVVVEEDLAWLANIALPGDDDGASVGLDAAATWRRYPAQRGGAVEGVRRVDRDGARGGSSAGQKELDLLVEAMSGDG
jgi:hypothetical protein